MDAKEIKSLLKQAREAIKEKDFKSALKHCKAALKLDKNNYNAWVFVGAAAQEVGQPDQSVAAFKRAIEISSDQVLAWQGLCSFYEKNETSENIPELISVYKKLLDLHVSENEKKLEIFDKLIPLLKKLNDREKVIKTLKLKLEIVKGDANEEHAVYKRIFEELLGETKLTDSEIHTQTEALQALVCRESFSEDDCRRIISTCIDILYKGGMEKQSMNLALIVFKQHPDSFSCLEFISRAAMNMYIDNDSILSGIMEISEKMNSFEMTSKGLPQIFEGFCLFALKKFPTAILKLKEGLSKMEYCVQGWYFLSKSQASLHQYNDAEVSSKKGIGFAIKNKASSNVLGKLYLNLGQVLLGKRSWDGAIKALEKCLEYLGQTKDVLVTFCFTLLRIGQVEKAENICKDLKERFKDDPEVLQLEGYAFLLKEEFDEALQRLRLSVSLKESAFTLHLIGLVLWESKQGDKAFKVFLKAAESDPFFAKNFMYLGHYYYFNLLDKRKAYLCYQKGFALDNSDTEIGMSLSQILKELGKEEENMEVLKKITENSSLGSCKWAWTQLGLYQLEKNNFTEAIFSLQKALRADPDSSHGWECLGDAYFKRGSFESALKAFERVSELNPKAMYPLYQIATIQRMRGVFTEAIEKFKNLLDIVPTYVPALIGLAETLVLSAKKAFDECLFGVARDSCQEALDTLAKVAASNTGLSCLWKLAGDACTLPFHFDPKWFPLTVPPELQQDSSNSESILCDKSQILAFGSKFFGRALLIKDSVSTLWHDLGVNCHFQSMLAANDDDKVSFAKKAFICLQKAISISPNYEPHWTALGVVALGKGLEDCAFGQHSLIKSLEINRHNAETWTNLGVLYLLKENIELSHFAFKMAQSAEPTFPLSWVGQAFIADKFKHSETLDLFRHATTLGSHNEALLGYSKAICDTLLNITDKESIAYKYNIEEMNAVVHAGDCAIKFVGNNCNSPEAFNILGMLLERQGIYGASLKAYERALKLLEDNDVTEFIQTVRTNYARLLSVIGKVKEAIKEFLMLKNVDNSVICSFAFALYKDKQYEQALKLFAQAFEKCKIPADKSHIKVAMAIVATNIKDGPNPLTLLFESTQIAPASVYGLLALYAGGILKEELNLLLAARKELHPYKYCKEYASSAALLWATHYHLMRGVQPARNELLKFLHCLPTDHKMWLQAAACLLQWDSKYADIAIHCTKAGVFHGGCKEQASQIFALSQMSKGYRKGALSAAQKAVHINPGKLTNWATLAAACHVADLDRKHIGWMFSFVKKLAKEQKVKPDFLGWLVVMEIFHHINCGNISDASALTNQVLSIKSFNAEILSCFQILDAVIKVFSSSGNLQPLFLAIKNNPKSLFGWNILSQLLLDSGNVNEAEKTLSHFALTCEKIFPKWKTYPLLQLAVLSYRAMHSYPEEKEKWLKLGEEVTGKAVHLTPSSQAARFLQGLFALESENTTLVRRSFEKVSCSPNLQENMWMTETANTILEQKNLKRKAKE